MDKHRKKTLPLIKLDLVSVFFCMLKLCGFDDFQGTMGCTPNSVPMVFIVFSRDSWG